MPMVCLPLLKNGMKGPVILINMTPTNELTNKDLLIRIDERQRHLIQECASIIQKLDNKVDKNNCIEHWKNYKEDKTKLDTLWDDRNKVVGMVLLASLGGGSVAFAIGKFLMKLGAFAFGG